MRVGGHFARHFARLAVVAAFATSAFVTVAVPADAGPPCRFIAQNPHNSTHVPGTVNAVMTASCLLPVERIVGVMSLYRDGAFVAGGDVDRRGNSSAQMNAATRCVPGRYHARGGFSVYYTDGTKSMNNWRTSNTVNVSC